MILKIDNCGAKDLANNWITGGKNHHVDMQLYFLCDLKEMNLVRTIWQSGDDNSSDLFTKNLAGPAFCKHIAKNCGE